jgi:hypothetical protein
LHLQILKPNHGERSPITIVTWPVPKPIYPDTYDRMKLGSIESMQDVIS